MLFQAFQSRQAPPDYNLDFFPSISMVSKKGIQFLSVKTWFFPRTRVCVANQLTSIPACVMKNKIITAIFKGFLFIAFNPPFPTEKIG